MLPALCSHLWAEAIMFYVAEDSVSRNPVEPDTFVQIRDVDCGRRALRHAGGPGVDLGKSQSSAAQNGPKRTKFAVFWPNNIDQRDFWRIKYDKIIQQLGYWDKS